MRRNTTALSITLFLLSTAALAADEYRIDPVHSSANFAVKHFLVSTVRGRFTEISGTILLDDADLSKSSVTALIKAASINTDNERRDNDLRSERFFDVQKYPEIKFQSNRIEKTADGYVAIGTLTMKDVSREIRLPFTLSKGEARGTAKLGVDAETKVNRLDYHINYDSSGATVGKEVKIDINVEATKAEAAKVQPKS